MKESPSDSAAFIPFGKVVKVGFPHFTTGCGSFSKNGGILKKRCKRHLLLFVQKTVLYQDSRRNPPFRQKNETISGIKSVRRTAGATLPFMPNWGLTASGTRLYAVVFSQSAEEPYFFILRQIKHLPSRRNRTCVFTRMSRQLFTSNFFAGRKRVVFCYLLENIAREFAVACVFDVNCATADRCKGVVNHFKRTDRRAPDCFKPALRSHHPNPAGQSFLQIFKIAIPDEHIVGRRSLVKISQRTQPHPLEDIDEPSVFQNDIRRLEHASG